MCLNLIGSQYRNNSEVERLLDNNMTEEKIIAIKDNRKEIERQLQIIESKAYIEALGI